MVPQRNRSFGGKMNNRQMVIDLLLTHSSLSRVDIARATHWSKPTASSVVAELISENVVRKVGYGESTGGRKPILLRLGGEGKLVVGLEVGSKVCKGVLVDMDGRILQQVELAVRDTSADAMIDLLIRGIDQLFIGRDRKVLVGCGVGVPGLIDPEGNTVSYATNLEWDVFPLKALLEARLHVLVMITDRGKAATLGELWYRGREKGKDLIYVYLGTGVGGGIVIGNSLHLGASHTAGEIGHMSIDPNGPSASVGTGVVWKHSFPALPLPCAPGCKSGRDEKVC